MLFDRAQLEAALPQYEVGAQLGRGGFGLVLEGRHRRLGRKVAIKILTISEPNVERRFLAEARVMAAFDHPHVVRVHDYAESDGLCLIVMEHLPGGALSARIRRNFPPEQACAIGLAVADAIHAAHQRGIVHRDIKPDNVLFAADGAVKVTDFGIAKLFEGATATTGSMIGTPAYASPEQIAGERIGPPTDVYALGGLLYHLLTGRPPFDLDLPVPAMLHHQLTQRPQLPAGMPERLAAVVGQALEKDPSDRPASAKVFALALAEAATADLGPGWAARSEVPLRIDDDLRNAAAVSGARYNSASDASRDAVTRVRTNEESYPGGRVPPGGATITPPEGTPPAWITPPPRSSNNHTFVPAQWNEDPGTGLNSLPPLGGDRSPELVPVTPNGRATTTSGGRHAAPDPEAGNSGGNSGGAYGGSFSGRRESASASALPWGDAPAPSSASQQRALESPSGRHAQLPPASSDRAERAVPPARAALISQLRRAMEAENQEPWWASRMKLIIAIVVLLVVAAISVGIGVAVGNAHRNSQLTGAPSVTHAV